MILQQQKKVSSLISTAVTIPIEQVEDLHVLKQSIGKSFKFSVASLPKKSIQPKLLTSLHRSYSSSREEKEERSNFRTFSKPIMVKIPQKSQTIMVNSLLPLSISSLRGSKSEKPLIIGDVSKKSKINNGTEPNKMEDIKKDLKVSIGQFSKNAFLRKSSSKNQDPEQNIIKITRKKLNDSISIVQSSKLDVDISLGSNLFPKSILKPEKKTKKPINKQNYSLLENKGIKMVDEMAQKVMLKKVTFRQDCLVWRFKQNQDVEQSTQD